VFKPPAPIVFGIASAPAYQSFDRMADEAVAERIIDFVVIEPRAQHVSSGKHLIAEPTTRFSNN
jgi:hypothetical protein